MKHETIRIKQSVRYLKTSNKRRRIYKVYLGKWDETTASREAQVDVEHTAEQGQGPILKLA